MRFGLGALHVVERFRREGDTLTYSATIEDPKMFTGPWVTTRTLRLKYRSGRRPGGVAALHRAQR